MFDDMLDDNDLERDLPKEHEDDLFKNFRSFHQDIMREMKEALKDEALEPDFASEVNLHSKDLDEYNCIFDKMEEEDKEVSVVPAYSEPVLNEISQSLDEIMQDFPGIQVKHNNFMDKPIEEQNLNEQQNDSDEKEKRASPEMRQLAKSVYVPSKSEGNDLLSLEEKPEFLDNQFWDLKHSQTVNTALDDLLADYN